MRKTILVALHELVTTFSRRSYILLSFGLPLFGAVIFTAVSLLKGGPSNDAMDPDSPGLGGELQVEGYVDLADLIHAIPQDLPSGILVAFADEQLASLALAAGEITAYYIIPPDYVETGTVAYVHPELSSALTQGQDWVMRRTLLLNLLGGDLVRTNRVWNPFEVEVTNLAPVQSYDRFASEDCTTPGPACQSSVLVRYIPFMVVVLLFMFITQGSGLLIRTITSEKQTRVIEILMLSVDPQQLLAGKLIGLGIASLLSTLTWIVTGFLILRFGGGTLNLPSELNIPPSLLFWTVVFFLLGYVVYASLMAGAGALVPDLKEITQATWVVMLPLITGYIVGIMASGESPHGGLSTALSLFPLTASIVMVMRLTVGGVPTWQLLTSLILMLATAVLIVRSVARVFRAQILLSGQPFSTLRYFHALLGREV